MADPTETPLNKKIVPARSAAQKAAVTLKQQTTRRPHNSKGEKASDDESDITNDTDDDDMSVHESPTRPRRDSRGPGGRGRGRARGRPRGRGRGRGMGADGRDSEQARVGRKLSTRSLKSHPAPSIVSPQSSSPLSPAPNTPRKRSWPTETSSTPSKRVKTSASHRKLKSNISPPPSGTHDGHVYMLNELVWIRLHLEGVLVNCPTVDVEGSYWWPAQITSEDVLEISVKLFGDDGYGRDRVLDIASPTPSIIVPFRHNGDVRFSSSNFTLADLVPEASSSSPQAGTAAEEEPSSLTLCWEAARDQALAVDMDDELPEADTLLTLMSTQPKSKAKVKTIVDIPETPTPSRRKKTTVAPLDMEIKVGEDDGEMVLARDHKDRRDYWPARVIAVSQSKRTGKWLYDIRFIDGKERKIDRSWFFAPEEEGFATCQVGEWRTEYPASDTAGSDSEEQFEALDDRRSTSPLPLESDLAETNGGQEFRERSLPKQVGYVYPFLCRVIRREYRPSFHRHDAFMKGGKAREQLGQMASVRGHFSENEVNRISKLVRKVMLRDERRAKRLYDEREVQGETGGATLQAERSDRTKEESVAESVFARSSDMDAAMALTELKASEEPIMPSFPPPPGTPVLSTIDPKPTIPSASQMSINGSCSMRPPGPVVPSRSVTPKRDTELHVDPPASDISTVLEHSSDMELGSDEERPSTLAGLAPSAPTGDHERVVLTNLASRECINSVSVSVSGQDVAANTAPQSRPIGCETYENLSRSERGLYCSDVLLPEAILQLHLFRDGHRSSSKLLTLEEEERLYEKGEGLLQQDEHWVTQFLQLRKVAEQAVQKRTKGKEKAQPAALQEGMSSRRAKRRA